MKNNYNNIRKYALRKLAIGVASCAIGCATLHAVITTVVHGDTVVQTEKTSDASVLDISELIKKLPGSGKTVERSFEKVDFSEIDQVKKALQAERPQNDMINIFKMRTSDSVAINVPISELTTDKLKELLGNDYGQYAFLKLNSKESSYLDGKETGNRNLYIVKKDARIINTEKEYNEFIAELLQKKDTEPRDIHSPFDFGGSNIDILLEANGFGLAGSRNPTDINKIPMYSGTLRLATSGEAINPNQFKPLTASLLDDYLKNDNEIIELIKKSGALDCDTDRERVKKWSTYVKTNFAYDDNAFRAMGRDYNVASSIFSAIKDNRAMCVGFSTLSARAYNLMGIRAYVAHGEMQGGAPHAVTRVYFDGHWHFVDTTAATNGVSSNYLLDTYTATEQGAGKGQMTIHTELEKWMEKQPTRDLLLINKGVAKIEKGSAVDTYAEKKDIQTLRDKIEYEIEHYDYLIKQLETRKKDFSITRIIEQAKSAIDDLKNYQKDVDSASSTDVVKSYIDSLEEKRKGQENVANRIEFELSIAKFSENSDKAKELLKKYEANQKEFSSQVQEKSDELKRLKEEQAELYKKLMNSSEEKNLELARQYLELGRRIEELDHKANKREEVETDGADLKDEKILYKQLKEDVSQEEEEAQIKQAKMDKIKADNEAAERKEAARRKEATLRKQAEEEARRQEEAQRKAEAEKNEALRQEEALRKVREEEEAKYEAEMEKKRLEAEQQKALEEQRQLEVQRQAEAEAEQERLKAEQELPTENEVTGPELSQYRIDKEMKLRADGGALLDAINYYDLSEEDKKVMKDEIVSTILGIAQQIKNASRVDDVDDLVAAGEKYLNSVIESLM